MGICTPHWVAKIPHNIIMNKNIYNNFINNLKKLRKQKNISQRTLSEFIGCDSSYIRNIEARKHKPSFDKLIDIANYFEIEFIELFKD